MSACRAAHGGVAVGTAPSAFALTAAGSGPMSSTGAGVWRDTRSMSTRGIAHGGLACSTGVSRDAAIAGASNDIWIRASADIIGRSAGSLGCADGASLLFLDLVFHFGDIGVDGLLDAGAFCLVFDEGSVVIEDVHDCHGDLLDSFGPAVQFVGTTSRGVATKAIDGAKPTSVHVCLVWTAASTDFDGIVEVGLLSELFDRVWFVEGINGV